MEIGIIMPAGVGPSIMIRLKDWSTIMILEHGVLIQAVGGGIMPVAIGVIRAEGGVIQEEAMEEVGAAVMVALEQVAAGNQVRLEKSSVIAKGSSAFFIFKRVYN